jgi:hypothetical protein
VATDDHPEHPWPEEEPAVIRVAPQRRSRLARIGRAIGDVSITVGMSRGLTGVGTRSSSDAAMTNKLLFGEADKKGREAAGADRDSGGD